MRTVTFTAAEIVDLFAAIEIAIEELDYRAEELGDNDYDASDIRKMRARKVRLVALRDGGKIDPR